MDSEVRAAPLGAVVRFIGHHWRRQAWLAGAVVVLTVLATLADIATPIFAGRLVAAVGGRATRAAAARSVLQALGGIAGLGAFAVAARQLCYRGLVRFTLRMMREVEAEAFARVQRFSSAWHAGSFTGATVRQITRGANAIDALNDVVLIMLLPDAAVLLGATALSGARWPVMGVAIGASGALFAALTVSLSVLWITPAASHSNRWDTRVSAAIADAVTCNATVKAFGAEPREQALLARVLRGWIRLTRRTWMRGVWSYTAQSAALLVIQLAITGTAALLWWQGRADAGDIAGVLATYFVLHGYLRSMGQTVRELQRGVNDMAELVALHATPVTVEDRPGAPPFEPGRGAIVFQSVTFGYGAGYRAPLFQNLGVRIAGGERVGLVGPSGSGKSTFVRLIQRLHDIGGGQIVIDGQDIAAVTQGSLRRAIAVVPQDPILFHRTLAANIAYARPHATPAEIERAARLADAHEFITRLPRGYETPVGERGVKLSGGERQRIAIARAFLADAPILILDEATSSLDSESEAAIGRAMGRLLDGRTAVVIAHRLSTVRAMDRILVFEAGRIVEEGTHETLIGRAGGRYRRLFETQALGLAAEPA